MNLPVYIKKVGVVVGAGLVTIIFSVLPAYAQILYMSAADLKAETKKSKRQARQYPAEYKETHLNTANYNFKKGQAGRKVVSVEEFPADYTYDQDINAIYQAPQKAREKKKRFRRNNKH